MANWLMTRLPIRYHRPARQGPERLGQWQKPLRQEFRPVRGMGMFDFLFLVLVQKVQEEANRYLV
jgi:hypothetical protein